MVRIMIAFLMLCNGVGLHAKELYFVVENRGTKWVQWYNFIYKIDQTTCASNRGIFLLNDEKEVQEKQLYFIKDAEQPCGEAIERDPLGFYLSGCLNRSQALRYSLKAFRSAWFKNGEIRKVICSNQLIRIFGTRAIVFVSFGPMGSAPRASVTKTSEGRRLVFQKISRTHAYDLVAETKVRFNPLEPSIFEEEITLD